MDKIRQVLLIHHFIWKTSQDIVTESLMLEEASSVFLFYFINTSGKDPDLPELLMLNIHKYT